MGQTLEQASNNYQRDEILSEATKTAFGLETTSTPNDVFNKIFNSSIMDYTLLNHYHTTSDNSVVIDDIYQSQKNGRYLFVIENKEETIKSAGVYLDSITSSQGKRFAYNNKAMSIDDYISMYSSTTVNTPNIDILINSPIYLYVNVQYTNNDYATYVYVEGDLENTYIMYCQYSSTFRFYCYSGLDVYMYRMDLK